MPPLHQPITDSDHLLLPHKKRVGPLFGIIVILMLLIGGALYLGLSKLQSIRNNQNQLPYIPASTTTIIEITP
jgi:CHASE3 domain sensor protein